MEEDTKRDEFELFMLRKNLSPETQKIYLLYFDKIQEILIETGLPICQAVVDAYLDLYPRLMPRATLKNYLEFMKIRDLIITKRTGRPERKVQVTISPEEREKVRGELYSHDERYGLIFDLTDVCALRRQEVINIKAEDISIPKGEKMFILIRRGKGRKERKVFVREDIAILVMTYLQNHPMNLSDYLFESRIRKGYPMDKTNWNKAFLTATEKVLGKRYHPHQLRGTRATEWYDKGIDLVSIKQRLGHSDISTTMLYIRPDERKELEKWSNE